MEYTYENPEIPSELNFTDVLGPDGYVSHRDVLSVLSAPQDAELVIAVRPGDPDGPVTKTGLVGTIINGQFVVPFTSTPNAVDCLRVLVESVRHEDI